VKLLKSRFGSEHQKERFRAELNSRRRKPGESCQAVYNDVRRLLSLAFPGQSGSEIFEIFGRDAPLNALGDPKLRVRVLGQSPKTIDETFAVVSRMEASSRSVAVNTGAHMEEDHGQRRIRTVTVRDYGCDERRMKELQVDLTERKRQIRQLKADNDFSKTRAEAAVSPWQPVGWYSQPSMSQQLLNSPVQPPPFQSWNAGPPSPYYQLTQYPDPGCRTWSPAVSTMPSVPTPPPSTSTPGRPRHFAAQGREPSSTDRDVCHHCRQHGHWKRECPRLNQTSSTTFDQVHHAQVHGVFFSYSKTYTHLDVVVNGVKTSHLIDSGSERNVIPGPLVENVTWKKQH